MTAIILIAIVIVFIAAIVTNKKGRSNLSSQGFHTKTAVEAGSLVGGHPDIDKELPHVQLVSSSDKIAICNVSFSPKGYIAKSAVKNVLFEDATTFGKRISAGRLLLVGVFALAWKKKSKNENAYVIIEWNDGRFDHSTSFLFEGAGSTNKANATRNWLLRNVRNENVALAS